MPRTFKNMLHILSGCFAMSLVSCASMNGINPEYTKVTIKQNGKTTYLNSDSGKLTMEHAPFSIVFYNLPYDKSNRVYHAARLAAFTDANLYESIKVGDNASQIIVFRMGTGMAADTNNQYSNLILNSKAHHYLPYDKNNSELSRVKLVSEKEDGLMELEFPISKIFSGQEIAVEEINNMEINIVLFIDRNLNNTIDNGELSKAILSF